MPRSKTTRGLVELLRLVPEGKKSMEPNKKVRIEGNFPKMGLDGRFLQDGRTMGSSKSSITPMRLPPMVDVEGLSLN